MKKPCIAFAIVLVAVAQGFNLPVARREASDVTLECKEKPVELGIVLDSSRSIWLIDFLHGVQFLQDLVSYFHIGPNNTRVSLISFGDGVHKDTSFNLDSYTTKEQLLEALSKTPHTFDKHTSTALGIDYMRDVQLGDGAVRSDANKIAVVITDGNSQNKDATEESAAKAEADGINMIAVGVGSKVNEAELVNIAAGNPNRVIRTRKYSQLKTVLEPLREKICTPVISETTTPAPVTDEAPVTLGAPTEPPKDEPDLKDEEISETTTPAPVTDEAPVTLGAPTEPPKDEPDVETGPFDLKDEEKPTEKTPKDKTPDDDKGHLGLTKEECGKVHIELGIILDSSSSIWGPDFERAKVFLQKLIDAFDIGPDKTRVSLILFGKGIYTDEAFNLTTYISGKDVKAAIGNIHHKVGLYTSTWDGINFMRQHQLDSEHVRKGLRKVAVVITDGNSQEGEKTAAAAAQAVEQDINMIAVGVGRSVNDWELENIAGGNSSRVVRASNFPHLITVLEPLSSKICNVNLPK